ncbi:MAG: hypothetical protein ABIR79_04035 [Candidatus Binatia bacterium]
MRQQLIIGSLVLLLAALPIAGCGDNDNNDNNDNGSGGSCGNGFIDDSSESCDGGDFDGATCQSLGFGGGTLTCGPRCQRDTTTCTGSSSRTPTPVVTATPGGPTATTVETTATPVAGDTPTVTPTPNGPTCTGSESIVVKLNLDADYTAARVDLSYPASANIPGSGTDTSVGDRVVFEGDGLKVRNDVDSNDDLVDDRVTAGFVATDVQTAGLFVTITFDCVAGQSAPSASDFTCDVVSASFQGTTITPSCTVAIQ